MSPLFPILFNKTGHERAKPPEKQCELQTGRRLTGTTAWPEGLVWCQTNHRHPPAYPRPNVSGWNIQTNEEDAEGDTCAQWGGLWLLVALPHERAVPYLRPGGIRRGVRPPTVSRQDGGLDREAPGAEGQGLFVLLRREVWRDEVCETCWWTKNDSEFRRNILETIIRGLIYKTLYRITFIKLLILIICLYKSKSTWAE